MPPHIYVGRFDPKFLGVTIRARDRGAAHSFLLSGDGQATQADLLGVISEDAAVSDLSRLSVVAHETRHFHDALLSPMGAGAIRSRLHASVNGFGVALALRRRGGSANAIAVPLQQWLVMPAAEREGYLDSVPRTGGQPWQVPELPVVAADDVVSGYQAGEMELDDDETALLAGCRLALADYRMIERLWRSPYPATGGDIVFPAVDAWEAAGLLCQFARIEERADAGAMARFQAWVGAHGPRSYQRGLTVLGWATEQLGWSLTLRHVLAITTWSQLGPYVTESVASSPNERLSAIVLAAQRGARWSADAAFADLVAGWDEVVGTDSIAGMRAATDGIERFVQRTIGGDPALGMSALLTPELLTGLAEARRRTLAAFLADPDGYIDPAVYVANADRYPQPAVAVQYPTGAEETTSWQDATPAGWAPAIDFDTNQRLAGMAELADAVFLPGEKSLQPSGRAYVREYLGLTALRVIR